MVGSSVKSCDLAEFQIAIVEQFMSLKHCINIRLPLSPFILFDSRHASSSFSYLQGKRSLSFCVVALIFSMTNDKAFKLGLCSVVCLVIGTFLALLSYSVFTFREGIPC